MPITFGGIVFSSIRALLPRGADPIQERTKHCRYRQALMLSQRHSLDYDEVHAILNVLKRIPCELHNGGMEVTNFTTFLKQIFELKHIPDAISEAAYESSVARQRPLDIDKFFVLYRNVVSVARSHVSREWRQDASATD
eukprot:TRINITY_DN22965_c0_g1_i1.p2 TRINITY_DN22965_c0_g1~~TRINITY_DN22965_c0_g1_i1.p2  ORF type:complete len:139 (+),score=11.46 TRINITY_DN22965_c0_g1_i1:282-698(+)